MNKERLIRYKEKIEYLDKTVRNLEGWMKDITDEMFKTESELQKRYSIYHAFQIAVEIILDIAAMTIKDEKLLPKDDYSNIDNLVEKNIINAKLGGRLKEANGLKNRIVHDYNCLDDSITYERILALIVVFKDYKNEVNKWLAKNF